MRDTTIHDGDERRLYAQKIAQRREHVLQKLVQVGRREQAIAQLLDPLDLGLILAIERPVNQRLGQFYAKLHEQDDDHGPKEHQPAARKTQPSLHLRGSDDDDGNQRGDERAAEQEPHEPVFHHPVRRQRTKEGDAIGQEHEHEPDCHVAQHQEGPQPGAGCRVRPAGEQQVGEDAGRRRCKRRHQVGHPPPGRGGEATAAGPHDVVRAPDHGSEKVDDKEREQRPGQQMGSPGRQRAAAHDEITESDAQQEKPAEQIADTHGNVAQPAPGRRRGQQRIRKAQVGGRYKPDTQPLDAQPKGRRIQILDAKQRQIDEIGDQHTGQQAGKCARHVVAGVVDDEVKQESTGENDDARGQDDVNELEQALRFER